jgi:hypothetical protein
MFYIIRLKSQKYKEGIFDYILSKKDTLQEGITAKGRLLYLSKREKHEDASLFVHVLSPEVLGDFITDNLSVLEHLTSTWIINMIKPTFFPLPKDTENMKRYSITLKVFPKNLKNIYKNIASSKLPDGLKMAYIAYTCHLYGDCLQFSVLSNDDRALKMYLTDIENKIPGVLNVTLNLIEKTKPLVSYEEWKQYSMKHKIIPSWDDESMIHQFQQ